MTNRFLSIMAYLGLLGGSTALGIFLFYAAGHSPKLTINPLLIYTAATIAWLGLTVYLLNKADTPNPDDN